jgi:hypothetical protein
VMVSPDEAARARREPSREAQAHRAQDAEKQVR